MFFFVICYVLLDRKTNKMYNIQRKIEILEEPNKMKKVLFISSTGGHLNELLQLSPLFEKYDYHIITEKDKANENLKEKYGKKIDFLPYGTRAKLFTYIFKYFYLCLKTI